MPEPDVISDNAPPTAAQPGRYGRVWLLLACLALAGAAVKFTWRGPVRAARSSTDLSLYYTATVAWVEGGNPYDPNALEAIAVRKGGAPKGLLDRSIAPPVTFVLLSPLAALSWPQARLAWLVINIALTVGICFWLVRLTGLRLASARAAGLLALAIGLAPPQTCIKHGQMALACVALLVGAIRLQGGGRGVLAGVLLALAGVLKPQIAVVFGAYWLLRGRWRAALTAAGLVLATAAVAVGRLEVAGVDWFAQWQRNIEVCFRGGPCDYAVAEHAHIFINLHFPLYAIFGDRTATGAVAWAFSGLLVAGAAIAWRRTAPAGRSELLMLGFLAVVCLLPVYHVFYDAAILVLPLAWAIRAAATPLRRYAWATILLTLPFVVSGAAAMHVLAQSGRVPAEWAASWWWRTLLLPHQPWLLAALAVVLTAALLKAATARPQPTAPA